MFLCSVNAIAIKAHVTTGQVKRKQLCFIPTHHRQYLSMNVRNSLFVFNKMGKSRVPHIIVNKILETKCGLGGGGGGVRQRDPAPPPSLRFHLPFYPFFLLFFPPAPPLHFPLPSHNPHKPPTHLIKNFPPRWR